MDNISINYTVREDEVPKEIAALYRKTMSNLEDLLEKLSDAEELLAEDASHYYTVLSMITAARNKLISVDMNLADCQNIISGYQKYLLDKLTTEQGQQREQQLELEFENGAPEESVAKINKTLEELREITQKVTNISTVEVDETI